MGRGLGGRFDAVMTYSPSFLDLIFERDTFLLSAVLALGNLGAFNFSIKRDAADSWYE